MGTGQGIALVVGVVIAVAAVGALAVGGLTATTVETDVHGEVIELPEDSSYAVVVATYKTKAGFGLLGFDLKKAEWAAQVTLIPPAGCGVEIGQMVEATGDCAGIAAEGKLLGRGGGSAVSWWNLEFDVSKECHEALEIGERWPTTREECA